MRSGEALDTHRVKYSAAVEILKDEILLLTTESKLQLSTYLSGKFAKEKQGEVAITAALLKLGENGDVLL